MTSFFVGGIAVAGLAWGYLSKLSFLSGAKYYVSQQLAQMQMHFYNKDRILKAAKATKDDRLPPLVNKIFEDYKKDIDFYTNCKNRYLFCNLRIFYLLVVATDRLWLLWPLLKLSLIHI